MEEPLMEKQEQDASLSNEEWRQRADQQINSLVRVFGGIGILALLGILYASLVLIQLFDDITYRVDGFGTNLVCIIAISAVGAVWVNRRMIHNQEMATLDEDDDCKTSKKKRQQENQRRLWSLFFALLALLFTLQMIYKSTYSFAQEWITHDSSIIDAAESIIRVPPVRLRTSMLRGNTIGQLVYVQEE